MGGQRSDEHGRVYWAGGCCGVAGLAHLDWTSNVHSDRVVVSARLVTFVRGGVCAGTGLLATRVPELPAGGVSETPLLAPLVRLCEVASAFDIASAVLGCIDDRAECRLT